MPGIHPYRPSALTPDGASSQRGGEGVGRVGAVEGDGEGVVSDVGEEVGHGGLCGVRRADVSAGLGVEAITEGALRRIE